MSAFKATSPPGRLLNKIGYFNQFYGSYIQLVPKGYAGRMPTQWEANLTLGYPILIGAATVTLQGYLFNVFNHQTPTYRDTVWSTRRRPGTAKYAGRDLRSEPARTNPAYGKVTERLRRAPSAPRSRVSF